MTGLVGWWPLHEHSGNTARDLSGNENHGSLNGGIVQGVAGKGGLTSYSFDGNDDYIDLTDGSTGLIGRAGPITVSLWVFVDNDVIGDGSRNFIFMNKTEDANLSIKENSGEFQFTNGGEVISTSASTGWHHLVLTYDGQTVEAYQDTNLIGTYSLSSVNTQSYGSAIGADYDGGAGVKGNISNVRVYDRALTQSEIQKLYDWGNGDYARPLNDRNSSSAVSHWAFDGDVTDSWTSNNGTDNTSAGFSSDSVRRQAKAFDGSDDYVDIGSVGISRGDPVTINLWIKKIGDITTSTDQTVFASEESNSSNGRLYIEADNDRYQFYVNSGIIRSNNSFNYGWNMHTFVCDGSKTTYYINNIFQESIGDNFSISNLVFGQDSSTSFFEGIIDDVRIYDKALSPSEVFELYRWGTRGRDLRKQLVNQR